jgi:hypothetical protein
LVDCVLALGWVPWVLVFDNMKTVTTGRDAQQQPIWHPALLQLAAEFDFHPEACWPGAGNQKGSVESLVKWVKGNFLAGRVFADDADLGAQCAAWLTYANTRPSQATDVAPGVRLADEATEGRCRRRCRPATTGSCILVAWGPSAGGGGTDSVPRCPLRMWARRSRCGSTEAGGPLAGPQRLVARRAPDESAELDRHYAWLFARKPRAQVMLYREALVQLGGSAPWYLSEVSRRHRDRLREEVLATYALYEQVGAAPLLAAMTYATEHGATGRSTSRRCWPRVPPRRHPPSALGTRTTRQRPWASPAGPARWRSTGSSAYEAYVWASWSREGEGLARRRPDHQPADATASVCGSWRGRCGPRTRGTAGLAVRVAV